MMNRRVSWLFSKLFNCFKQPWVSIAIRVIWNVFHFQEKRPQLTTQCIWQNQKYITQGVSEEALLGQVLSKTWIIAKHFLSFHLTMSLNDQGEDHSNIFTRAHTEIVTRYSVAYVICWFRGYGFYDFLFSTYKYNKYLQHDQLTTSTTSDDFISRRWELFQEFSCH